MATSLQERVDRHRIERGDLNRAIEAEIRLAEQSIRKHLRAIETQLEMVKKLRGSQFCHVYINGYEQDIPFPGKVKLKTW